MSNFVARRRCSRNEITPIDRKQNLLAECIAGEGTPGSMCPEMLRGEGCTEPGDCWALGVVLFELLTLRAPFTLPDGANLVALMFSIASFDGKLDAAAAAAIAECGHPPELCALASGAALLHPTPAKRTRLAAVLERFPDS